MPLHFPGEFDCELFKSNIRAAIDQYIGLVDRTPAMKTHIRLFTGKEESHLLKRRPKLLIFLKGSQAQKAKLMQDSPALYSYFQMIWGLKERHEVKSAIPGNYMFMLSICGQQDCVHPRCCGKESTPSWFPGGPSVLTVLPVPAPEVTDVPCSQCKDTTCFGHYSKLPTDVTKVESAPVPSVLISEEFSLNSVLTPSRTQLLATKAMVDPAHVSFQWKHLEQVKVNRAKGVEKAKKTRALNKAK